MTTSAQARERIMAAAYARFAARGIRRVTMDDIARDIRMSKKTLYRHFTGKHDLVRQLALRSVGRRLEAVCLALDAAATPREGFAAGFMAIQRLAREAPPEFLGDIRADYPEIWTELEAVRMDIVRLFARCLAQSAARGELRQGVVPEVAAGIMQAVAQHYMVPETFRDAGIDPREAVLTWFTMLSAGLFRDPPRLELDEADLPA
ncbi:TetR/AcrR family transcriptional regulator [Desulfocurvus sp.]|uniref:TetR/AcrR family transcriptional regulator n=1 Tax=Desulfocurvus sp. TaxID=2871698 RepID=UPI0025C65F25|nr:TetR/AcrR family transcriptional regulator [Desulfocurvus sp.]MCK9239392.1 TetR/AcrR family transcriptional regulator [Desulfocurvus sp.]